MDVNAEEVDGLQLRSMLHKNNVTSADFDRDGQPNLCLTMS
jgi:hypothetical protein